MEGGNIMDSSISEYSVSDWQNAGFNTVDLKPCWVVIDRVEVDLVCDNIMMPNSTTDEDMTKDIESRCFTTLENVRDNSTSDAGAGIFLCECCGAAFAQEIDLKRHTQDDCTELNTSCKNSVQSATLIRDDNVSVLCEHCGTPFVQEKDLKSHMESDCGCLSSVEKYQSTSVEKKQPQGDSCGKYINRTHNSQKYIKRAHPSPEVKIKAKKDETPEFELFCDFCGKSFRTKIRSLNDIDYYTKYSELQGVCRKCNIDFSEYYSFNRDSSSFTCSCCGMCYKQVPWLKNHVRQHAMIDGKIEKTKRPGRGRRHVHLASRAALASSGFKGRIKVLRDPPATSRSPDPDDPDDPEEVITGRADKTKPPDCEKLSSASVSQSGSGDLQERPAGAATEPVSEKAPSATEVKPIADDDGNTAYAFFCEFCGKFFLTNNSVLDESEYYTKYSQLQGVCSDCNIAYHKYYRFNNKTRDFICKRCGVSHKQASWLKIHLLQHAKTDSHVVRSKQSVVENLPVASESLTVSNDLVGRIASHAVRTNQSTYGNLPSTSEAPLASGDLEDTISRHIIITEQAFNENLPSCSQSLASGNLGEGMTSVSFSQPSMKVMVAPANGTDFFEPFFVDCEVQIEEALPEPPLYTHTFVQPASSVANEHTSDEAVDVTSVSEFLTFLEDSSVNIGKQFEFVPTENECVVQTGASSADPSSFQNSSVLNCDTVNTGSGVDPAPIIVSTVETDGIDSGSTHDRRLSSTSIDIEPEIDPAALVELVIKMDENVTNPGLNQGGCLNSDGIGSGNDDALSSHGMKPCFVPLERVKLADLVAESCEADLRSDVEHPSSPGESPHFTELLSSLDVPEDPSHFMHYLCQSDDLRIDRTQCSECGKNFARSQDWRKHVEKVHNVHLPFKDSDVFMCPRCAKPIKYRKAYENHLTTHAELDKLVLQTMNKSAEEHDILPSDFLSLHTGELSEDNV